VACSNIMHSTLMCSCCIHIYCSSTCKHLFGTVCCLQEINEAEGIASVHEAFKLGINFFDSSPFYGSTKSETVRLMLQQLQNWQCWDVHRRQQNSSAAERCRCTMLPVFAASSRRQPLTVHCRRPSSALQCAERYSVCILFECRC
jgi:hypothetical protein